MQLLCFGALNGGGIYLETAGVFERVAVYFLDSIFSEMDDL